MLALCMVLAGAGIASAEEAAAPAARAAGATNARLTDEQIRQIYALLEDCHGRYLAQWGVKLPTLRKANGEYTLAALTLVYLAQGYPATRHVSKSELTEFVRAFYPQVNDVQQARHLGAQFGWYILSGTRNDDRLMDVPPGEYKLVSLEEPYPGFSRQRRTEPGGADYWERLKAAYGYRCACCGSKEGEPSFLWPDTITVLQKGHMDPAKPLEPGNVIPQCVACNQPARDFWVFDEKGRVVAVANPLAIDRSSADVQFRIYERLYRKYGGRNPLGVKTPAAEVPFAPTGATDSNSAEEGTSSTDAALQAPADAAEPEELVLP